jgi:hypothetical protein
VSRSLSATFECEIDLRQIPHLCFAMTFATKKGNQLIAIDWYLGRDRIALRHADAQDRLIE